LIFDDILNSDKYEKQLNEQIDETIREYFPLTEEEKTLLGHTPIPLNKVLVPKDEILYFAQQQLEDAINIKNDIDRKLVEHRVEYTGSDDENYFWHPNAYEIFKVCADHDKLRSYIRGEQDRIPAVAMPLLEKLYKELLNDISELQKQYNILAKGENGENLANKYFSLFSEKYQTRKNIIIPVGDAFAKSSEIDTYIITSKGLFVCEIKNWGNEKETIVIENDGKWYRKVGRDKMSVSSPVEQNTRHCIATEKYLKQHSIECRTIPIIVMANSKVNIENNSQNVVLRVSEVYNYIENLNLPATLSKQDQRKIVSILDSCERAEKKFQVYEFESQKKHYQDYFKKAFEIVDLEMNMKIKCGEIVQAHIDMLHDKSKKNKKTLIIGSIAVVLLLFLMNPKLVGFIIVILVLGIFFG